MSQLIIGVTGGIGCGKTAATNLFAAAGAAVVDADVVSHELTAPGGAAIPAIRAAFGDAYITAEGALDRTAMRKLAFSDPEARQRLEHILHPMVRSTCDARCKAATSIYAILTTPLLVESGIAKQRVARLAVVDCPEEMQISRVMARNGLSRTEIERIMATQASRAARRAAADDLIDNSGDLPHLQKQVELLHAKYLDLARIS